MICFASADHFIKLLTFENLLMLIQPVSWVFGYELFTPMLLISYENDERVLYSDDLNYINWNII